MNWKDNNLDELELTEEEKKELLECCGDCQYFRMMGNVDKKDLSIEEMENEIKYIETCLTCLTISDNYLPIN